MRMPVNWTLIAISINIKSLSVHVWLSPRFGVAEAGGAIGNK